MNMVSGTKQSIQSEDGLKIWIVTDNFNYTRVQIR